MAVPDITGVTRSDAVLRGVAQVVNEGRRIDAELTAWYARLYQLQNEAVDVGVVFDLTLAPHLAAGYSEWKRRLPLDEQHRGPLLLLPPREPT